MLKIITNTDKLHELLNTQYKIVELPYKRLETVIAYEGGISKSIEDIIHNIEECKIDNNGNIESKFTQTPISINKLSEGCKTAIYVYYRTKVKNTKEIINITSCGANAIQYIIQKFGTSDMVLYLGHFKLPKGIKCKIEFNGKIITNTNDIFKD